ncbi:hypothetical protein D3C72_1961420 [compost metagenome]
MFQTVLWSLKVKPYMRLTEHVIMQLYNRQKQAFKSHKQISTVKKEIWPVIKYWLTKTRSLNRFMIMPYQMLLLRKHR